MKEKPILFSTDMVRAILVGDKTQTRRVIKPQPLGYEPSLNQDGIWEFCDDIDSDPRHYHKCPYKIDQTLWIRETFCDTWCDKVIYKADGGSAKEAGYIEEPKWKPSIFMPRSFARIFLEVTNIRAKRIHDISEAEAEKEGIQFIRCAPDFDETLTAKQLFSFLWDSINKKRGFGWDRNPWVWVIEFKRILK